MDKDRNLLLGVLAVQLKGLTSAKLVEVASAWAEDPHISVADRLVDNGLLTPMDRDLLERLVDDAIQAHGGDTAATLHTLGIEEQRPYDSDEAARLDALQTAPISGLEFSEEETELFSRLSEAPGRYTLISQHARGGMGRVLMVHDEYLDRNIALKELMSFGASGSGAVPKSSPVRHTVALAARFLQEARITGQLDHPSIVPVYEVGRRQDGTLYYTMKFVRGKTLGQALRDAGELEKRLELLPNFVDLCQAIAYAHDRGVIHRDIKPANVMVGSFGETVVLDWGLAKLKMGEDLHRVEIEEALHELEIGSQDASPNTAYGRALGTPHYMPPEQAAGNLDNIDERSDVYSLGAVLYELLTGTTPYTGRTTYEVINKVLTSSPIPVLKQNPDTPPEIAGICDKAMQRNPADRYQSAVELAADIRRFVAGSLVHAYQYSPREIVMRYYRRHRTLVNMVAIFFLLLTGFGVYSYLRIVDARNQEYAQRVLAEKAQKNETQARERAEREAYITQLGLLQQYLQSQDLAMANRTAAETQPAQRGWEWGYLVNRANQELLTIQTPSPTLVPTISSDGQWVAASCREDSIRIWDLNTGQLKTTCEDSQYLGVPSIFSRDGKQLLGACLDGKSRIWDTGSGKLLQTLSGNTNRQGNVVFSPDGSQVLSCEGDGSIRLWEVTTGNQIGIIETDLDRLYSPVFSPDGTSFAAVSIERGIVKVWNRSDLSERFQCMGKDLAVFSPDGCLLATTSDASGISLWDAASGVLVRELPLVGDIRRVRFNSQSDRLLAASNNGSARLWSTATGELLREFPHGKPLSDALLFPNGQYTITCSYQNDFIVWETATGAVFSRFFGQDNRSDIAFSPDMRRMAAAEQTHSLRIFDPLYQTGRTLLNFHQEKVMANSLTVGERAGKIAAVRVSGIQVFSLDGRGERMEYPSNAVSGQACHPAFSDEGSRLAMVLDSQVPCVWNLKGEDVVQLFGHEERIVSISLDPSGNRALTTSGDMTARIWDVQSGNTLHVLSDHTGSLSGGVFSPDGTQAVTVSDDGTAMIWNVRTGDRLVTLKGHGRGLTKALFSQDGKRVYTASKDKTVRIWDAVSGNELEVGREHSDNVSDFSIMDRNGLLLTNCADYKVRIWDAHGQELLTVLPEVAQLHALKESSDLIVLMRDGRTERWEAAPWRGSAAEATSPDELQKEVAQSRAAHYARVQDNLALSTVPARIVMMASDRQVMCAFQRLIELLKSEPSDETSALDLDKGSRYHALGFLGFKEGDVLSEVARRPLTSRSQAVSVLEEMLVQVRANPVTKIDLGIVRRGNSIPVQLYVRPCRNSLEERTLSPDNMIKVVDAYTIGLAEGKVYNYGFWSENDHISDMGLGLPVLLIGVNRDLTKLLGNVPTEFRLLMLEDQPLTKCGDTTKRFQELKTAIEQGRVRSFSLRVQYGSFISKDLTYTLQ